MSNTKPIFSGEILIEVEASRYAELIAKEEKLRLLENALSTHENYSNLDPLKKYFEITEEKTDATEA